MANDNMGNSLRAKEIVFQCHNDRQELKKLYPKIDFELDARFSGLARLSNSCTSLATLLHFTEKGFSVERLRLFWMSNEVDEEEIYFIANEATIFLYQAFLERLQSTVEYTFRLYDKILHGSSRELKAYKLNKQIDLQLNDGFTQEQKSLLKLVRELRNTNHNNGIHFSYDKLDTVINWNNKEFTLRHGKIINIMGWTLLLDMADGLRVLLKSVAIDPAIARQENIIDESFKQARPNWEKYRNDS